MRVIILSFLCALTFKACCQSEYDIVLKVIQDDILEKNFIVSSELIPFNLITISENVIKEGYISDYTIFKELRPDERKIEKIVNDSLINVEATLNAGFKRINDNWLTELSGTKTNPKYVIFFSALNRNSLYVEIIQYSGTTCYKNAAYGQAKTYLFVFDMKGKIQQLFKGEVNLN